jgi:16S rRNA (uracil1498-N3)-methyltransferase
LRQIFIQGRLRPGGAATVTGADHHHLTRSLRAKIGEPWLLVDDAGDRFEASLESVTKLEAILRVTRGLGAEPELPPLTLALCLPKLDALDACLDAATQLGVTHFVPLNSARSQAVSAGRQERWQRIVRESCCQCLRSKPMQILEAQRLEDFLGKALPGRKLLAWQAGKLMQGRLDLATPLTFLIGPEGGFEEKEIAAAMDNGWEPLSLGPQILRVPVALAAGLGALQAMRM